MKFNFYISCENDQEARECIDFIAAMTAKREGRPVPKTVPPNEEVEQAEPADQPKERPNVSPGKSSISKIGGETKAMLIGRIRENMAIDSKYDEHLKLLWTRGEVKFDGEEYWL